MSFREMRRSDRLLDEEKTISCLQKGEYGTLASICENGYPYSLPISYAYYEGAIYVHSAVAGQKLDNITNNKKVSFSVVNNTDIVASEFTTKYESVVVFGDACEVFDDEKEKALVELIKKYSPDFLEKGLDYISKASRATKVIKIEIKHITGKGNV